ncbi:hypothetical protein E0493_09550 [Roseomonas sp. M0104]|uniref:Uncharacterized protein n=1 Tax=Teichococcus coralli TaxID=2545983 RepID=A0A845B8T9_9PROT|nr:hypothetical protein [Pseudoroseomonas coralli]MXP63591.1 hypothetical protein [Pseudoroseomonas coralli]
MNAAAPARALTPAPYEGAFLHTPRAADRWPLLIFRWGGFEAEIDGPFAGFVRIGRLETYSRWEAVSVWRWQREPGALEIGFGRYHVTISRSPEA